MKIKYDEYVEKHNNIIEPIEDTLCDLITLRLLRVINNTINDKHLKNDLDSYIEDRIYELMDKDFEDGN